MRVVKMLRERDTIHGALSFMQYFLFVKSGFSENDDKNEDLW